MEKIAFIAHGVKSAHTLYPIIEKMKKQCDVHLFAFHEYVARLWEVEKKETNDIAFLIDETFDLIITGTSSMHITEQITPILANTFDIPVVSILDSANNYEKRYRIKPDYVICLNKKSENEILKLGFKKEQVFPFGNPYFEPEFIVKKEVLQKIKECEKEEIQKEVFKFLKEKEKKQNFSTNVIDKCVKMLQNILNKKGEIE